MFCAQAGNRCVDPLSAFPIRVLGDDDLAYLGYYRLLVHRRVAAAPGFVSQQFQVDAQVGQ